MEEEEDYYFDEDQEEIEEEEIEDENRILEEYRNYWREQYDPRKPGLSLPASLQREKLLKKPGEWEKFRQQRIEQLRQRSQQRSMRKQNEELVETMKSSLLCQNLSLEEQRNIPSDMLISLRMTPKEGREVERSETYPGRYRRVCYRLDNLYSFLHGRYGPNRRDWIDPFTKVRYSFSQQDRISSSFKRMFPCQSNSDGGSGSDSDSNIGSRELTFPTELIPQSSASHRIQIPDSYYSKIISSSNLQNSPYIFVISNYPFQGSGRRVENSNSYFVGLDAISSHKNETVGLSSKLMEEMKLKGGDLISIKECFGLPLAKKIVLKVKDRDYWNTLPFELLEDVRSTLEELISNNYFALQVAEIFDIEIYDKTITFILERIETVDGQNILSALNVRPGGLTLDLEII